jgi:hypothetical protein
MSSDQSTPPSLSDLIRGLAPRDRLRVDPSATTKGVSAALHQLHHDQDAGEATGGTRLVGGANAALNAALRQALRGDDDIEFDDRGGA